ncbi:MAG: aspartate kinase [Dehalococcoidales bacterium]
MALIVQKYGGSSLCNADKIKEVAEHIIATMGKGAQPVVVVSAMQHETDKLLNFAEEASGSFNGRELAKLLSTGEVVSSALLAGTLQSLGYAAISLTGAEAGIRTDANYTRARILKVDPKRVIKEIEKGRIVIVAGFQGITDEMDITTLGRGGTDITAVVLAAALGVKCVIYHEHAGVYTADPRLVPEAQQLSEISYEELLELAGSGSKVLQPRAVELGWVNKVPILITNISNGQNGTLVHA